MLLLDGTVIEQKLQTFTFVLDCRLLYNPKKWPIGQRSINVAPMGHFFVP